MKQLGTILFWFLPVLGIAQKYTDINGLKMYYEVKGEGNPLLVLHGGTGSIESMTKIIDYFSESYRVIANDREGHGKTSDTDKEFSYSRMTDNTVKLLDHLNLKQVNVIGYSDGGIIALELAMRYPERIKKAVYVGTNYHHNGMPDEIKDWIRQSDLSEKIKKLWLTQPTFSIEDLKKIKCPSLILIGDRDGTYLEHTISLYRNIENAELSIIPDASHAVLDEKPKLVHAIMEEFLKSKNTEQKRN